MLEWAQEHRELFMWISIASAVFFVGSLVAVGIVIIRLPADYLRRNDKKDEKQASGSNATHVAGGTGGGETEETGKPSGGDSGGKHTHLALRIAKNILGWALIAAGLAMLVLPGQGLLVLLIGVMLADFRGKKRVERWILSRAKVMKSINWVRQKFDKPPMEKPAGVTDHATDHKEDSEKHTSAEPSGALQRAS